MTLGDLIFLPQGTPKLNIQAFDCGRESVNEFFHNEAQDYQDELFGKTYYWVHPDHPSDIVAGFTVANACIFTKQLPNSRQKKIGREVHHEKGLINYPSILLAQLGVDVKDRPAPPPDRQEVCQGSCQKARPGYRYQKPVLLGISHPRGHSAVAWNKYRRPGTDYQPRY